MASKTTKVLTLRIPNELWDSIDFLAQKGGCTRNDIAKDLLTSTISDLTDLGELRPGDDRSLTGPMSPGVAPSGVETVTTLAPTAGRPSWLSKVKR